MTRPAVGVIAVLLVSGAACIKANPDFVETDASSGGTTGSEGCGADGGLADPDTEADAIDLGGIQPGASAQTADGATTPDAPTSWFDFTTTSPLGSGRIAVTIESEAMLELCVFAECVDAPALPAVLCSGGTPERSPAGRAGCCGTTSAALLHACGADVLAYVRVVDPDATACEPFRIEYRVTDPGG